MNIVLFKELVGDYNSYNLDEIAEMQLLTLEEVDKMQREIEIDSGNLSDWDHLRLCFTCKYLYNLYYNK